MDSVANFQPWQIVYIDSAFHTPIDRLYAEVIDIIESRQMCWARPLLLAQYPDGAIFPDNPILYDLRQGADILLPISLFRAALDIEIIPLLVNLNSPEIPITDTSTCHQQLNNFVRLVCQAYPGAFN